MNTRARTYENVNAKMAGAEVQGLADPGPVVVFFDEHRLRPRHAPDRD
ncbi:MAG: hypothetical protein MZW92_67145 [Comamonadaceae bacterium]|nr:hypothetical protein [Comamonadaceae bacterium]